MSTIKKIIKEIPKSLKNILKMEKTNPYLYGIVIIALTMYGPRLSPGLPTPMKNLFNSTFFRILILALIIYLSSKNLPLALIVSVGFVLVVSLASSLETFEYFENLTEEKEKKY